MQSIFRETTSQALRDSLSTEEEATLIERARTAAETAFSARAV